MVFINYNVTLYNKKILFSIPLMYNRILNYNLFVVFDCKVSL